MSKIIGNTTTTPVPRSDWKQVDSTKADFILNKPTNVSDFNNDVGYITNQALLALLPKVTYITLDTTWNGDTSPYYQDVALSCCTETSMVDIQPTPEQLADWQDDGLAFTTLSGDGTARVYVTGGLPTEPITVQVKVQEVVVI